MSKLTWWTPISLERGAANDSYSHEWLEMEMRKLNAKFELEHIRLKRVTGASLSSLGEPAPVLLRLLVLVALVDRQTSQT